MINFIHLVAFSYFYSYAAKKVLKVLIATFPIFRSVDTMEVRPATSTNPKRKADEMESNVPEDSRPVKVLKTESVERKCHKLCYFPSDDFECFV